MGIDKIHEYIYTTNVENDGKCVHNVVSFLICHAPWFRVGISIIYHLPSDISTTHLIVQQY